MTTSTTPCFVSSPATLPVFGTDVQVFLGAEQTGGQYTAYICTVPPAGGPPPHRHDFDEAFYVLEGTFEILCGTEVHVATPGTCAFVPRGVPHTFKNVGDGPATFHGLATPGGHEAFFEDAACVEGPLDVATAIAICQRNGIELLL